MSTTARQAADLRSDDPAVTAPSSAARRRAGSTGAWVDERTGLAKAGAFLLKTVDHLGGELLRIRRRAAVAARENFSALCQAMHHQPSGLLDVRGKHIGGIQFGLRRGLKMTEDSVV